MQTYVHVDFRKFISYIRQTEDAVLRSVQDPELKTLIYQEIAASGLIQSTGHDTGATDMSIAAVANGFGADMIPYANERGTTRYAYSKIDSNGIYIDPVDEYGRNYGEYSVDATEVSDFRLTFGDSRIIAGDRYGAYNEIYRIIKKHLEVT